MINICFRMGLRDLFCSITPEDCCRPVVEFLNFVLELSNSDFFVDVEDVRPPPIRKLFDTPAQRKPDPSTYHSNEPVTTSLLDSPDLPEHHRDPQPSATIRGQHAASSPSSDHAAKPSRHSGRVNGPGHSPRVSSDCAASAPSSVPSSDCTTSAPSSGPSSDHAVKPSRHFRRVNGPGHSPEFEVPSLKPEPLLVPSSSPSSPKPPLVPSSSPEPSLIPASLVLQERPLGLALQEGPPEPAPSERPPEPSLPKRPPEPWTQVRLNFPKKIYS